MPSGPGGSPGEGLRPHCAVDRCRWCERDDLPCRFCSGTGRWSPQRPGVDGNGAIEWARVDEQCRMCAGTGREHSPLTDPPDPAPAPSSSSPGEL
ncbi:hypothetical protein [Nocardiopsis potens]|uniref:hypothetical protein n=1 Tax=Nocardiopsis potens TaxID=1246458 RepID=UPI0003479E90|nr:hypothetical protein [Nocardiopsis potens]